jgi:hypothetical protein
MTHLFYIILITNYENKQQNKLTPEFGFVSNRRWEEQKKMKLLELTRTPTIVGIYVILLASLQK